MSTITGMTFNQFCAHLADEKREERRGRREMRKQLVVQCGNVAPLASDGTEVETPFTSACTK